MLVANLGKLLSNQSAQLPKSQHGCQSVGIWTPEPNRFLKFRVTRHYILIVIDEKTNQNNTRAVQRREALNNLLVLIRPIPGHRKVENLSIGQILLEQSGP